MKKNILLATLLLFFFLDNTLAQKRICVLGSSTAAGSSVIADSSWPNRVKKYYKDLGLIDTLFNLAVPGTDTYSAMPSSYTPPPGRNQPDVDDNITRAVNLVPKPDVIILNFPSNNFGWLSYPEIMATFTTIRDSALASGIACFISTTQPRDDFNATDRQKLKDLKFLIESTFGANAIDFWTDVTEEPSLLRKPEYAANGDLIHLNEAGHLQLKNRVILKSILTGALACSFQDVSAIYKNDHILLQWSVYCSSESFVVQSSTDGITFKTIATDVPAQNNYRLKYAVTADPHPAPGINYYRVMAVDPSGSLKYSPVVKVSKGAGSFQANAYPVITGTGTTVTINNPAEENVAVLVYDASGKVLQQKEFQRSKAVSHYINLSGYAKNVYYIRIHKGSESKTIKVVKQ